MDFNPLLLPFVLASLAVIVSFPAYQNKKRTGNDFKHLLSFFINNQERPHFTFYIRCCNLFLLQTMIYAKLQFSE